MPAFPDRKPRNDGHVAGVSAVRSLGGAGMTEAVDDATGEDEAGGMASGREETGGCADGDAEPSTLDGVSDERHARAQHGDTDRKAHFSVVEKPAVPTIGCEVAILVDEPFVARRSGVEGPVVEEDVTGTTLAASEAEWAVRVVRCVFSSVMLAVDPSPLSRLQGGGDPQHDPARGSDLWSEFNAAVREVPVQIHRGHEHRELGDQHAKRQGDEQHDQIAKRVTQLDSRHRWRPRRDCSTRSRDYC